jgi:hypothetical protein
LFNTFTPIPNTKTHLKGPDNSFGLNYDKEKYKDMLLDAAETVLGIFGFDRTLYGKPKDKQWWIESRRNKTNDVQAEAGVR